ncbi:MAG: hypothetical protein AAF085_10935 [Planctomycetota bacterium]
MALEIDLSRIHLGGMVAAAKWYFSTTWSDQNASSTERCLPLLVVGLPVSFGLRNHFVALPDL